MKLFQVNEAINCNVMMQHFWTFAGFLVESNRLQIKRLHVNRSGGGDIEKAFRTPKT